ncbi:hypothetical protein DICPUDRAFT_51014 [Dictyostelium purpureum]|uniref:5-methyltetrahydropteroyltriglutamate--homocysteine S-methyltransferase n=1 Tax=Dictyostelium purpureum TaxID=5786 RepID=F1A1I5_DICPU|nr:uncharacterized protein DICPUDRAFT_51014 [Dictyostelium purpureum]EGC29949.1 hypothetical protein DICPUDRAFT_51014 [Dictyostelium purpureum]|eukprot:XP_003293530.1 hypothetical protein DICPUDRAFT_51014 [Dictyostelium purpureum]
MVSSSNLGFPRMGENRDLKKIVEAYWAGKVDEVEFSNTIKSIRAKHWTLQKETGINIIPSNDFSLYDHVLDHVLLFGAIPKRYEPVVESEVEDNSNGFRTYFAMARGYQTKKAASEVAATETEGAFATKVEKKIDVGSFEMKKWFDTNYHYMVPEFEAEQQFKLTNHAGYTAPKPVHEFLEAKALGIETRPVILGPISFLLLGKSADSNKPYTTKFDSLVHLEALVKVYEQLFEQLVAAGVKSVQIDEPVLCFDLLEDTTRADLIKNAFSVAYNRIHKVAPTVNILIATYFGEVRENIELITSLPINGVHIDRVRSSSAAFDAVLAKIPSTWTVSIGIIEGRNIWKNNLNNSIIVVKKAIDLFGSERVIVSPSCSLLHSPHSLAKEVGYVKAEVLDWLAFAVEKLKEIAFLAFVFNSCTVSVADNQVTNVESNNVRKVSKLIHNDTVKSRVNAVTPEMFKRINKYPVRRDAQRKRLTTLPDLFPTTTIGSFPQTQQVRVARQNYKSKKITAQEYDQFIRSEIKACVQLQEECGLDVLVHGEFERNDMVEYFGENLEGFVFTANGWVQSYGSRCVKPPIIYGDVHRPNPMTLEYTSFAQTLTAKPMKGMLTGPVTILQWSFVRDDQTRSQTCNQIALAIRDEVVDLETAGIAVVQIDEPAIREGLPLRHSDWNIYLEWAVNSFLLSSTGVKDSTQIHSHMCYSDFNDIFESIQNMDCDVLTIENSKSDLKLLKAFEKYGYTNEIGPGLYDIHSPRIPSVEDMKNRVEQMLKYLPANLLWVNPDCGLKTNNPVTVKHALVNMVKVAVELRAAFSKSE